jgi:hypothetical protein
MLIPVLDSRIVNNKGSCPEISVSLYNGGPVFCTDIVNGPLVGFHRKAMLVSEGMGLSDGVNIIGYTVTFGTEVTIMHQPVRRDFGLPLYYTEQTGNNEENQELVFHRSVFLLKISQF